MLTTEKINELSQGIEYHLRKLEGFVSEMREMKNSLNEIRNSQERHYMWEMEKFRAELAEIRQELRKRGLPDANKYELEYKEIADIVLHEEWPMAVHQEAICDSDEKQKQRAQSILDLVVGEHLEGKSFLDYGCGDGHIVVEAQSRGAKSIGYDLKTEQSGMFKMTFGSVKESAPFDIILMHDVLDHIENISPIEALLQAKSVLAPEGRIYIRNHPWSSRHGGHLYEKINRAYLHLVLDEVELTRLGGYSSEYNIRVVTPVETYRHWFEEAELEVKSEIPISSEVEPYFKTPSFVRERLLHNWNGDEALMLHNMEIDFVEYVVEAGQSNQQIF